MTRNARRPPAPRYRYPYAGEGKDPSPRQVLAHSTHADERFYGGAAGGGKTDWLLGELVRTLLTWRTNGIIFRRTLVDLNRPGGIIRRLLERIPQPSVGTYNKNEHVWTFRNGSILELGHLERDGDVLRYQGADYGVIGFDELTQFTEYQFTYLINSRLRIAADLEARGFRPFSIAAANPGGPGHGWVKARYVDPAPPEVVWQPTPTLDEPNPGSRLFIPARVSDNPGIDSGYVARLEGLPEDDRRALLYGDWDVYSGQRFRDWRRDVHVIDPEQLPITVGAGITRAVGVDYGYDAPFAAVWGARMADDLVVIYRELYQAGLTPTQQAELLLASEAPGERAPGRPSPVFLDPSTWARTAPTLAPMPASSSTPPPGSLARSYTDAGVPVEKANNDRLAGVALVADKLRIRGDGRPRLLVYSSCRNLIRTLPALPRSTRNPEDVDTLAEDHIYDALRYLLMGIDRLPSAEELGQRRPAPPTPAASPGPAAGIRHQGF